ncbi:MAG: dockerin type I domain-containing protein [Planctomycetota bacterium]
MKNSILQTAVVVLISCGSLAAAINSVETLRSSPGDLTGDGIIDHSDLRLMLAYFRGAQVACSVETLDFNRDRRVDIADLVGLSEMVTARDAQPIEVAPTTVTVKRGDLSNEGQVDIADFYLLTGYLAGTLKFPAAIDAADLNGDKRVDVTDLSLLAAHLFGHGR